MFVKLGSEEALDECIPKAQTVGAGSQGTSFGVGRLCYFFFLCEIIHVYYMYVCVFVYTPIVNKWRKAGLWGFIFSFLFSFSLEAQYLFFGPKDQTSSTNQFHRSTKWQITWVSMLCSLPTNGSTVLL